MKALLIIDIQIGLTSGKKLFNEISFIDTVNSAIQKIRDSGNIVVFVQHSNKLLVNGEKAWEIDNRLDKNENDIYLQKQHGNAFQNTDLKSILEAKKVDEIVVCGLVSHGCVRATCLGGLDNGFSSLLLKNGHTNWNKDAEIKILKTETELVKKGVMVIDAANI
ncbi:MAG: isochorismatase family protein [Saprospiraceae bacterium]|nr:isochorismatase family protein [Saprospiraceae bacterium]